MNLICKPFVFLRHGETPLNRDRLIGGRTDVPLTENGEQQARNAAPHLANHTWSCIAVSDKLRARQTAALALPGLPKLIVPDLRERDWGDLELRPYAEQPPYEQTPSGGESWDDFCARITGALNQLLQQYDTPLVVAHSGVFRVLNTLATGSPYGPRIGNAAPMWIMPGHSPGDWTIIPLDQRDGN
ncbi:histidine phosphatase family protein [Brenneria goodwinii]|nr:histidine phosphatase family protein [Brenneria goodwinii]MCG8175149.1 histidine phosphatase family protein [Brenneria goodwinii]MCG8190065.1 histidine phosphatase family protein [Brenneria goodwinii]